MLRFFSLLRRSPLLLLGFWLVAYGTMTASLAEANMTLNELMAKPGVTSEEVQKHLSALPGDERVRQATTLDRKHQKTLWELSDKTAKITLEEVVPPSRKALDPLPFEGQNNQPIYRMFKKVFYRTSDGKIAGYNESDAAWFAGPGYYILTTNATGTFVDYTQLPKEKPAGWPEIKDNTDGISRFIYGNMHDYLRRVSNLIFIGRAYRHGKESGNYFILARPE